MTNGTLTLNGVTDRELLAIMEVKLHHEGKLQFNPQQMQPMGQQTQAGVIQSYNNVVLTWAAPPGLDAVKEILHRLTSEKPDPKL